MGALSTLASETLPLVLLSEAIGVARACAAALRPAQPKEEEAVIARVQKAVAHVGRALAFNAGIRLAVREQPPGKPLSPALRAALAAFILDLGLRPFVWSVSLYVAIRVVTKRLVSLGQRQILHPAAIFALHCLHNDILVNRAEWAEPAYIKLWLVSIPGYSSLASWLRDFASSDTPCYPPALASPDRIRQIPRKVAQAVRFQFPFVALLFSLPHLIAFNKTLQRHFSEPAKAAAFLASHAQRVVRSSLVLAMLPLCLSEFPSVYASLRSKLVPGAPDAPVPRARLLHVLLASLCSTAVFLAEPPGRLRVLISITYWRVLESFIRRACGRPPPAPTAWRDGAVRATATTAPGAGASTAASEQPPAEPPVECQEAARKDLAESWAASDPYVVPDRVQNLLAGGFISLAAGAAMA